MTALGTRRPIKPIFQPIHGRAVRKLLWKRLGIPRAVVHSTLSAAKVAANPGQVILRRRMAEQLGDASQAIGTIPPPKGCLFFGPETIPGTGEVVESCAKIFDALRGTEKVEKFLFNPRKRFLLALLKGDDFREHPDLIRFMVSHPILDTVTHYLGAVPLLAGATLWWTPENQTAQRSQCYHFDGEDRTQVKVLINIFATNEEHGPFTLLPADVSAPYQRAIATRERLSDEQLEAEIRAGNELRLTGPRGSGGFVDTGRCLHYGSRQNVRERLMLKIQFLRFQCPTESTFRFRAPLDVPGLDPDPMQKLVLGIR